MKTGLQLKTSQSLTLAPQLQQAIRLLLLSSIELQQEVQEMMESNPFLDEEEHSSSDEAKKASQEKEQEKLGTDTPADELGEMDWSQNNSTDSNVAKDDEWQITDGDDTSSWGTSSPTATRHTGDSDDDNDLLELYSTGVSLAEHLDRQARALYTTNEDTAALMVLVNSLDENGYLDDELVYIAEQLLTDQQTELDYELQMEDLEDRLSHALLLLQSMDPPGIGARNLTECLTIQLKQFPSSPEQKLAISLCTHQLEALARRDFKKMMADTRATEDEVRAAFQLILSLNPKPGRQFSTESEPIVIPDVIVRREKSQWQATLNPEIMPNIRVNDVYANAMRGHKSNDGAQALNQRLQEARWFIKNIQQRFDTILRVSQAIIDRQKNFFTHGAVAMRPLILKEIADELELHESTISRVTTAKYMLTPFGIFELKFFFGSGLSTDAGGNASSTAVKALLKKIITEEDPKKPLSDSSLSKLLDDQGIQVARRTVAKYRDELKIPTATLRKEV